MDGRMCAARVRRAVFAGGFRDSPEWGSSFLFLADFLWQIYGDDSALTQHYGDMKAYVQYLLSQASPPFIIAYGLGDWCDYNSHFSYVGCWCTPARSRCCFGACTGGRQVGWV